MKTPFLVGEVIYLRPLEAEDGPAVAPWLRAAELTGRFAGALPMNEDAARNEVAAMTQDERQVSLAVALRADDRLVGVLRLFGLDANRRFAGYRLALASPSKSFRNHEVAAREATRLALGYAFDTLNLNRVYARVVTSDRAALARYKRLGFVEEGVLRQEAWREGRYEDVAALGVLRGEYRIRGESPKRGRARSR